MPPGNFGRFGSSVALLFLLATWAQAVPVVHAPGYDVQPFATGVGAPSGMALSSSGDLYLTDYAGGQLLRVAAPFAATGNGFQVVATGVAFPTDIAFAFMGRLFVSSSTGPNSEILEVLSNGSTQVFASGFSFPTSMAAFGDYLYVASSGNGTVAKVDSSGTVSPFLSGFSSPDGPYGLSFDQSGNLYVVDHATGEVFVVESGSTAALVGTVSPFGGGATTPAANGAVFVNDVVLGNLDLIDSAGTQVFASGFAGKLNPPYNGPGEVVLLSDGAILVADAETVWRIAAVPESGTIALLLAALSAVGVTRRRRISKVVAHLAARA